MSTITVHRHMFTPEEVAAALIGNIPPRDEIQVRYIDGYVEIDVVNPRLPDAPEEAAKGALLTTQQGQVSDKEASPGEPEKDEVKPDTDPLPERKIGRNEQAALDLLSSKAFQVFLEVKTAEAARAILLRKCGVDSLDKFDNNKTAAAALHDLDASYEAWCMAAD